MPPTVTSMTLRMLNSASLFKMKMPGMVNARPPATMAPADIQVWATLISLTLVLPMAFRANMDARATNMMGQGRDDAFRATNMEEHVKMMEPTTPIIIARAVNCSLKELACLT